MLKPLIIVESPTKRDTIKRFLGSNYTIEASVGHIRDLPESGKDVPEEAKAAGYNEMAINIEDDFRPWYVVSPEKKAQVAKLKALLKDASELLLATDEDREGESISWHLREVLKPKVPVKRMVFHEITPEAIKKSLANPRDIDENLVQAQETRRVLDRLVGYAISPVLWRKIRGARSAGRVQSPAVRLLVDRELERIAFRASNFWDVEGDLKASAGVLPSALQTVGGKRLARGRDFDEKTGKLKDGNLALLNEPAARALAARLQGRTGRVVGVDSKPWRDRPFPPFTTSTIQMEANRKLRWSAKDTMKAAQKLYELGWITYMRTDSVALSDEAIRAARGLIVAQYGADYLPPEPRRYKSTAKNAQEAHEAIRPSGTAFRSLDESRSELDPHLAKLYELVWKRTVACQMADAHGMAGTVTSEVEDTTFVATGRTITFPGFQRAYVEGSDDPDADLAERERILPAVKVGDSLTVSQLTAKGHTTQPPARLTEATLVKELERLGIGRPSTYADIIRVVLERGYAFKRGNALVPTHLAMLVVSFLRQELSDLVSYDFTAKVENDLDSIALGKGQRSEFLKGFYLGKNGLQPRLQQALAADATALYRLPVVGDDPGDLHVRVGQYGAYVTEGPATANVPAEMAPDEVTIAWAREALKAKSEGPAKLGTNPAGTPVLLMNGRFGPYVQLGEAAGKEKPPRASLLPGMTPATLTLAEALALLSLPRTVGKNAAGVDIIASNGRFGPYVRCGDQTRSVAAGQSVLHLTLEEALALLATAGRQGASSRSRPAPLRELGNDPASGGMIKLMDGRFGAYVTDGETNATVPKGTSADGLTLEDAAALLANRRAAGPSKKKGRFARKPGGPAAKSSSASAKATKGAGAKSTAKAAKGAGAKSTAKAAKVPVTIKAVAMAESAKTTKSAGKTAAKATGKAAAKPSGKAAAKPAGKLAGKDGPPAAKAAPKAASKSKAPAKSGTASKKSGAAKPEATASSVTE